MAHIVLAWELGAGYGHTANLNLTASLLIRSGHRVSVILPNVDTAKDQFSNIVINNCKFYPSPILRKPKGKLSRQPDNFSEILLSLHYSDPGLLSLSISEWRELFESLKPELVCFDSAPTAILACRSLSIKTVDISFYYFSPPECYPLPSFTYNKLVSRENLKKSDDFLLTNIRKSLQDTDNFSIYEYLNTDVRILATIPELDFYAEYRDDKTEYTECSISGNLGSKRIEWQGNGSRKRIFAYLKASYPCLKRFLSAIGKADIEAKIFISGVDESSLNSEFRHLCQSETIELSATPYLIDDSLEKADLFVCHSGGSVMHAISHTTPLLLIPLQREQMMTAQCCIKNGIAVGLNPQEDDLNTISQVIHQGLSAPSFGKNIHKIRRKYALSNPNLSQKITGDRIEALLQEGPH